MLFLLFELGRSRYAIDAAQVVEVLPILSLVEMPGAPPGVAGAFSYHGTAVPVIDLSQLVRGRPAPLRLSTRILLVRPSRASPGDGLLGLIAERATETLRREPAQLGAPDSAPQSSLLLGRLLPDERGFVQWIDVEALLPEALRAALSAAASPVAESPPS
jgi:chemotaxis-related protein WspB